MPFALEKNSSDGIKQAYGILLLRDLENSIKSINIRATKTDVFLGKQVSL